MVEGSNVERAGRRFIGQHDVQTIDRQLGQEVCHFALLAYRLHGLVQLKDGLHQLMAYQFWQGIGDADLHAQGSSGRPLFDGVEEFLSERKNILGIEEYLLACLSEAETTRSSSKKLFSKHSFQFGNLRGDGRL